MTKIHYIRRICIDPISIYPTVLGSKNLATWKTFRQFFFVSIWIHVTTIFDGAARKSIISQIVLNQKRCFKVLCMTKIHYIRRICIDPISIYPTVLCSKNHEIWFFFCQQTEIPNNKPKYEEKIELLSIISFLILTKFLIVYGQFLIDGRTYRHRGGSLTLK